jgi:hypothetical protein
MRRPAHIWLTFWRSQRSGVIGLLELEGKRDYVLSMPADLSPPGLAPLAYGRACAKLSQTMLTGCCAIP